MEGRIAPDVASALEQRGHHLRLEAEFYYKVGHAHAITVREGTLMGGADPRGDGAALGF